MPVNVPHHMLLHTHPFRFRRMPNSRANNFPNDTKPPISIWKFTFERAIGNPDRLGAYAQCQCGMTIEYQNRNVFLMNRYICNVTHCFNDILLAVADSVFSQLIRNKLFNDINCFGVIFRVGVVWCEDKSLSPRKSAESKGCWLGP